MPKPRSPHTRSRLNLEMSRPVRDMMESLLVRTDAESLPR